MFCPPLLNVVRDFTERLNKLCDDAGIKGWPMRGERWDFPVSVGSDETHSLSPYTLAHLTLTH